MNTLDMVIGTATIVACLVGCNGETVNTICGDGGDGTGGASTSTTGEGGGGASPDGGIIAPLTVPIECGVSPTIDPATKIQRVNLDMPPGSYLRWITMTVVPVEPHAALPDVLPTAYFSRARKTDPQKYATFALNTDPSTTLDEYEEIHPFTIAVSPTAPGVAVDNENFFYAAFVTPESGSGPSVKTAFGDWTCHLRLGSCVDPKSGEPLPAGSPCGHKGTCGEGGAGHCVEG